MDTVCGVGLPELIVLALVGFVVIGPERSRDLALTLGRWLRTVMKSSWWKEFNQVAAALRDLPTTLVRMAELEDELREVRSDLSRATRVDFNQSMGGSAWGQGAAAPRADADRDPWGVLGQTPPPPTQRMPPTESSSTSSEDRSES